MSNHQVSISKNALSTSFVIGSALIVLSILYYALDVDQSSIWGNLVYVVLAAGMVWGTLTLRDKYRNGGLSYGDAFLSNLLIGTFSGAIGAIYSFIFYKWIAPEQISVLLQKAEEKMLEKAPDLAGEQLDAAMKFTEKFLTPIGISLTALLSVILVSLILALIIAIFLKKPVSAGQIFANTED